MTTNDLAAMTAASDRAARYGVHETNPLALSSHTHETVNYELGDIPLSDPDLISINRLRLLGEPGYPYYDISYCYGTLKDGTHVRVDLGAANILRRNVKGELIRLAKEAGRFAKGMGLLDEGNWSILS